MLYQLVIAGMASRLTSLHRLSNALTNNDVAVDLIGIDTRAKFGYPLAISLAYRSYYTE